MRRKPVLFFELVSKVLFVAVFVLAWPIFEELEKTPFTADVAETTGKQFNWIFLYIALPMFVCAILGKQLRCSKCRKSDARYWDFHALYWPRKICRHCGATHQ